MGEAKLRGDRESRVRQAIQAAEYEAVKRKIEEADRKAAECVNGNYVRRSKSSLALAIAAAMAISMQVEK